MKNFREALKMEQGNQKNLMRNTRGITLIALVITVIVMLILAGVAISVLTDDGGLFEKTRGAAEAYENSAEKEAKQIDDLMNDIDQYIAGLPVSSNSATNGSWNGTVNTPKLAKGMTAVYWDENGAEKELTKSSSKAEWEKWYSYTAQTGKTSTAGSGTSKWANAVTKDNSGNITGYWVWIPRYEYKLTTSSKTIAVNFISTKTTTPSSSDYKIHPVFTTNTENGGWDSELPGFWVAKYPAGYQKSTVNESGVVQNGSDTVVYSSLKYTNPGNSYNANALGQNVGTTSNAYASQSISYPVFKPLTYAYNCINIDSMNRISQDIKNASNFYGLTNTTDSHLMKNSEWGAVAYLAWSQYGRNATEPNINNVNLSNKDNKAIYAVTGMAATGTGTSSTSGFTGNAYNTPTGQLGSTTGNITGVYDMNGCVWEYVAGYLNNTDGATSRNTYGASLMSVAAKYKTIYTATSSTENQANQYAATNVATRYGDAVKETSTTGSGSTSWNGDYSYFPFSGGPFFVRGGFCAGGASAGLFAFDGSNGGANYNYGFRVCLVPGSGGTL